jgi:hypothetical protein
MKSTKIEENPIKLLLQDEINIRPKECVVCPNCKAVFIKNTKNQLFCSERCRNRAACKRYYQKRETTRPRRISRKRQLESELAEARARLAEYESLTALQHKHTIEADKLWRQAHNQPNVWPDLGELIGWLMSVITQTEQQVADLERDVGILEADREPLIKELAGARARADHLERIVDEMVEEQAALCAEDQSITELVVHKDKLIEQMRDALKALKQRHYVNDDDNWYSCPASGLCSNDNAGTDCNCGADYVNSIIEAALSAAERGEV